MNTTLRQSVAFPVVAILRKGGLKVKKGDKETMGYCVVTNKREVGRMALKELRAMAEKNKQHYFEQFRESEEENG